MMEAGASGLGLIAPAHSAYLTYLDSSTARWLPSRELPAVFEENPATAALFRGANWWERMKMQLSKAFRPQSPAGNRRGRARGNGIVRDFTWERATTRLIEILSQIDRPVWRWPFRQRERLGNQGIPVIRQTLRQVVNFYQTHTTFGERIGRIGDQRVYSVAARHALDADCRSDDGPGSSMPPGS